MQALQDPILPREADTRRKIKQNETDSSVSVSDYAILAWWDSWIFVPRPPPKSWKTMSRDHHSRFRKNQYFSTSHFFLATNLPSRQAQRFWSLSELYFTCELSFQEMSKSHNPSVPGCGKRLEHPVCGLYRRDIVNCHQNHPEMGVEQLF